MPFASMTRPSSVLPSSVLPSPGLVMTRSWHGEDLAALTPPEHHERRHDEDEQHGRYQVVDHAARISILAA
jgi:hypothetical protein